MGRPHTELNQELAEALTWLEGHVNLEAILIGRRDAPTLERMRRLCHLMGDPQQAYPVIHITGTNGKGSTARIITALLTARGLSVGTYTSPDLERINERLAFGGEPIGDETFVEQLSAIRELEALMPAPPNRFEILTAAALRWYADVAVDVAVLEVGLGGRWDATNVADGTVAVVTNVSFDHVEILGPTLADIAAEKAGIVKPGATRTLVLGETSPELRPLFVAAGAGDTWVRGEDFACLGNRVAHGGRVIELSTPFTQYPDLFLPLHGSHQGDNAAAALAAVDAFFGEPSDADLVAEALAAVTSPGRMEVVGRRPLCILDAAHNPAGAEAAGSTLEEEFGSVERRVVVMGVLKGRDVAAMLEALDPSRTAAVVACAPPSPRAMPPDELAAVASGLGLRAEAVLDPVGAVRRGLEVAGPDDLLLVTGSVYLVGAVRRELAGSLAGLWPAPGRS